MLRDAKAKCKAVVPLEAATPYFTPQYLLNFSSNSVTYLLCDDTQPDLTASVTHSSSFSPITGSATGTLIRCDFEPPILWLYAFAVDLKI
jgi:hypothetical protein